MAKAASTNQQLDFYLQPGTMTDVGPHATLFDSLPCDVAALAGVVQGLAIHEFMAPAYGASISDCRRGESHIRRVGEMLDRILALDARPLTAVRPPDRRLVGVCHHFALLLIPMLRAAGIPARARCGFGDYFNRGYLEDHWVCEYWDASERRWLLADPQFDDVWRTNLAIEHDVLDVPRERFLVAADAWLRCRAGDVDPAKCGIFRGNLRGLWFVAGNLVRDVAALEKMEMLPWDVWGAMPRPDEPLSADRLAFFDRLAALAQKSDAPCGELRALYKEEVGLRVPATVFNALLGRPEAI
jgi:Transglutaminase-like superfamily